MLCRIEGVEATKLDRNLFHPEEGEGARGGEGEGEVEGVVTIIVEGTNQAVAGIAEKEGKAKVTEDGKATRDPSAMRQIKTLISNKKKRRNDILHSLLSIYLFLSM